MDTQYDTNLQYIIQHIIYYYLKTYKFSQYRYKLKNKLFTKDDMNGTIDDSTKYKCSLFSKD